ncbi:arginase family protein [Evansella cellulosilytica]|uniref:Arginase family enzyme n=1 Tax=Evansella cellulosilytica (strain ATCC 21833 / DSM 2522 / FERM P-1141 / JCM 9156 / N-4) TaxID=649639 RepID=E6TU86_EVAC2|nr:arginase family protein [Evansella cellulosilytica]ADU28546.1 arginase family enzyme [Evansella cellulosilytica DSM 2522]
MSLTSTNVTVLDFDHTYLSQKTLLQPHYQWLDFSKIHGTQGYCNLDTLERIRNKLIQNHKNSITFLGNGNYHYISYLLIERIKQPFTLILFDNHTDTIKSSITPYISCGSWLLHAVESLPSLQHVIIVGTRADLDKSIPNHIRNKVTMISNHHPKINCASDLAKILFSLIKTEAAYISIDKDVLDESDAYTNWDHGIMRLSVLNEVLDTLYRLVSIIGVDICGEYRLDFSQVYTQKAQQATFINEKANEQILKVVNQFSKRIQEKTKNELSKARF